ncbi:MAG TPA: hypothetical protein VKX17_18415 [Planctomycetota bacterium]|nr:hypothetical protein [Planctomycetota bacterium]
MIKWEATGKMSATGNTPVRRFLACDKCGTKLDRQNGVFVNASDGTVLAFCKATCDDKKRGPWSEIPNTLILD